SLISRARIRKFYRPSEKRWVVIGIDPVRSGNSGTYEGIERRRTGAFRQMLPIDLVPRPGASR
ncbi:MAG TPA: hypothetical protein VLS90_15530, partial [Thermodesulfobacteriota bacterium]|nr:hypothetical protein [Thermodesulfobacteriota bacterium]